MLKELKYPEGAGPGVCAAPAVRNHGCMSGILPSNVVKQIFKIKENFSGHKMLDT